MPADVVLLVGIMGSVCVGDIQTLVDTTPQFCRTGATVVWSRRVGSDAITEQIPVWFESAGFEHVRFERPGGGDAGVGVARYVGGPVALEPGRRLFTFVR